MFLISEMMKAFCGLDQVRVISRLLETYWWCVSLGVCDDVLWLSLFFSSLVASAFCNDVTSARKGSSTDLDRNANVAPRPLEKLISPL